MAFRTIRTTLCAATLVVASSPAFAILQDAGPATAATTTASEAGYHHAVSQQPAGRLLFESDAPIGMTGTDPANGSVSLLNQTGAYFGELLAGDISYRPHTQGQSEPEPGNLPLLGAAGVALLIAQLRRSRRPAVR